MQILDCRSTELTGPGEWTATYDTKIALPRLEKGRCPSCGEKAVLQATGWRRCVRSGWPYPVEFQVRPVGADVMVVFRGFEPVAS